MSRKKTLAIAGLLVFVTFAQLRRAAGQVCRADAGNRIYSSIIAKYGRREAPDPSFKFNAGAPDIAGLSSAGFDLSQLGDPGRDPNLVSYVYSVKRDAPAWRLHISTVGNYAVLQLDIGGASGRLSGPLVSGRSLPRRLPPAVIEQTQQLVDWLRAHGFAVLGYNVLNCPTNFSSLGSLSNTDQIRYWQALFRFESQIPGRPPAGPPGGRRRRGGD